MTTVLPLSVHPFPLPAPVLEAVRVAKEAICARDNLDFKLQVFPAQVDSDFRALTFKGPPPFMADCAKLRNWEDPAELMYWLEWVLNPSMPVELGFTKAQWLALHIPGAKEVFPDAPRPTVSFVTDEMYERLPY